MVIHNVLGQSNSTYLKQHAKDPVAWQVWEPATLELAKSLNRPLFISIGYAACHWCHVMAHESFSDPVVGKFLNENFICIKIDKEEHPVVDEVYMTAVQMYSGSGGWPMTLFANSNGDPFFAGTYFPNRPHPSRPTFISLAENVAALWIEQQSEIVRVSSEFAAAIKEGNERILEQSDGGFTINLLEDSINIILEDFDSENGGFGDAPKFPPYSVILLLSSYVNSHLAKTELSEKAKEVVLKTMNSLCSAGIHDHIGGGIHRYSTDAIWHLPHFEKMLGDQLLFYKCLEVVLELEDLGLEEKELFEYTKKRLIECLKTEFKSCSISAIDADSLKPNSYDLHPEEGAFYTWTSQELREVLADDFDAFAEDFGVLEHGNFYEESTRELTGLNILNPKLPNRTLNYKEHQNSLKSLKIVRDKRPKPQEDMTIRPVLNSFSALLGFCEKKNNVFKTFDDAAMELLFLSSKKGILPLKEIAMLDSFRTKGSGLYHSAVNSLQNLGNPTPIFDQPMPSGNAVAAFAFVQLGIFDEAEILLNAASGYIEKAPSSCAYMLFAGLKYLEKFAQVERSNSFESLSLMELLGEDYFRTLKITSQNKVLLENPAEKTKVAFIDLQSHDSQHPLIIQYSICDETGCMQEKTLKCWTF